jgi:hypothetical protein
MPFSTWSLAKLADFLVAEGVVDDISQEGLKELLRKDEVSFPGVLRGLFSILVVRSWSTALIVGRTAAVHGGHASKICPPVL